MKVKLLISRVGKDFSQICGEIVDIDNAEALRMINAGQCIEIAEVETATAKKKIEKAQKKKAKK